MIRGAWGRDPAAAPRFSLMSVAPAGGTADILAKTVGRGTALLERSLPGAEVDVLGPLGTDLPGARRPTTSTCWSPAGSVLPPLYMQGELAAAQQLVARSRRCSTAAAARKDLVLLPEMEAMGLALHLTTEDGSVGTKGLVTRALEARLDAHRGKRGARDGLRAERDAVGGRPPGARARDPLLHLARGADGVRHRRLPRLRDPGALAPLPLRLQQRARCSTPPTCSTSKPASAAAAPPECPA